MLGDISSAMNIYVITGYTDYLRRIVIREVFGKVPKFMTF